MAKIERDGVMGHAAGLDSDERLLAEFRADPGIYWKNHLILGAVLGTLAGLALVWIGNPFPWTGPVAAIGPVFARALYLRSEALGEAWRLTPRRLLGPGGRIVPLSSISALRVFFGDVQIVTHAGDKHLMKYLADAPAVIARIQETRR